MFFTICIIPALAILFLLVINNYEQKESQHKESNKKEDKDNKGYELKL